MTHLSAPRRAARRLLCAFAAGTATFLALPADAQTAYSAVNANSAGRFHDTRTGQVGVDVSNGGSVSGTSGVGGGISTSVADNTFRYGNVTGASEAYASADLRTGSLHAAATSTLPGGDSRAVAQLSDVVTFHVAGATAQTLTPIGIDITFDGSFSQLQSAFYRFSFVMPAVTGPYGASVAWDAAFLDSPTDPRNYVGWAVGGGAGYPLGWQSWSETIDTATVKNFHGVMLVPGPASAFALDMRLNVNCGNGTNCDFLNTARLGFDLPTGTTFTSETGLLLSAVTVAPVPEPSEWALMAAGLLAIGTQWRRQRLAVTGRAFA